jgi:hypothetical protein
MCALSLIRSSSWSCKSLGCGFSVGKADNSVFEAIVEAVVQAIVEAVIEAVIEAVVIYYD